MEIIAGPCSFESYKQTKDTVKETLSKGRVLHI